MMLTLQPLSFDAPCHDTSTSLGQDSLLKATIVTDEFICEKIG